MEELLRKHVEGLYGGSTVTDSYQLTAVDDDEVIVAYHFVVIRQSDEKVMTIGFDIIQEDQSYEVWESEGMEEDDDFCNKLWCFLYEIAVQDGNIEIISYI